MLSILLSAVMMLCMTVLPAKSADAKINIKIGDYIRLGTYNNESVLWRCVNVDDNGPLMLSDRVLGGLYALRRRQAIMPIHVRTGAAVIGANTAQITGVTAICVHGLTQRIIR